MRNLRIICLFAFLITLGSLAGCGEEDLFTNSGEIRCSVAVDDDDSFCGRSTNPGRCCYRDPCAFLSLSTCTFCDIDLSPCCRNGEKLCGDIDLCIGINDKCPTSDMPITTEFITFDVGDVDCVSFFENTLDISGVVMGPAGSEWTVTIPEMPNVDLQFGVTLFCTDWTFQDGSCVRMEGDPAFTDMYIAINVRSIFETPTPEVDFRISTQDDSRTVTHISCPGF